MASDREMWAFARQVLTGPQYETLWLHEVVEMPVVDIAAAYGVSRQAVDARLAGARRRLLRAIKEAA